MLLLVEKNLVLLTLLFLSHPGELGNTDENMVSLNLGEKSIAYPLIYLSLINFLK